MEKEMTKIRVYADWQPGYMGEKIQTATIDFNTIDDAKQTIDSWRKTACTVIVSEYNETILEEYIWGKRKRVEK
jgi:hypothetical protein